MNYVTMIQLEVMEFVNRATSILLDSWWVKGGLSVVAAMGIWILEMKSVQVFGVFTILVLLDLLTKWAAIAYQMLLERGMPKEDVTMWDKYKGIMAAYGEKRINSKHMRKPFVTKLLTYIMATSSAMAYDHMAGQGDYATHLVWLYLSSAEFLSILENMRDGGNVTIGKFLEIVQTSIDDKIKQLAKK